MASRGATLFGKRAREARLRIGLKQTEVAERVGLNDEVYGRIERGTVNPRLTTFEDICEALAVEPNDLLLGERAPVRDDELSAELRQLVSILHGAHPITVQRVVEIARWMVSERLAPPSSRSRPRRRKAPASRG